MKPIKILLIISILSALISFVYYFFSYVYIPQAKSKGCTPLNFRNTKENENNYLIWETQIDCAQYVKYGLKDSSFPYLAIDEKGVTKVKDHKVLMSGVDSDVNYYIVIIQGDTTYGKDGLPLVVKFN